MKGSEGQSQPQHQTDNDKHHQQQLGLGFRPSLPHDLIPNRDPPVISDNLMRIVTQELQNVTLKDSINEEAATDEERELKQTIDEELYHLALKEAVNEALEGKSSRQPIYEDEELKFQTLRRFVDEALDRHRLKKADALDKETDHEQRHITCKVLEESEKGLGHKEDPQKDRELENGVDEKGLGHGEDDFEEKNEIEEGNGNTEVKYDDCEGWRIENEEDREYDKGWRIENEEDREYDSEEEKGNAGEIVEGYSGAVAVPDDGKPRRYNYPLRPDAEDCSFYVRTGMCKFGSNCKFNHPLRRKNQFAQSAKETIKRKEENSDKPGQTECKYYLSSGGCKYGKACKYNHSRGRAAVAPVVEFNFLGLPIRPGEKECPYYMRKCSCKYGSNCRFNHPDPTAGGGGDPPAVYGDGRSVSLCGASQMSSWSSPISFNETAPFVPMMYSPTQGIPSPNPEWNGYQAPVYPTSERSLPTPPAFFINNPPGDTNLYTHHQQQMLVGDFPERPGQPECSYFLKTGDCKYRSACKFHHPKSRIPKTSSSALSDKGLPLRPDQNICTHYSRFGICKYGPACKYDHPVNYTNSTSAGESGPDGHRMAGGGTRRESLILQPV